MFVEPHFGQNFNLRKSRSCSLVFSIDFLKSSFNFSRLPNSLNLNSLASLPHNGQCCPSFSCLLYVHLVFRQVQIGMLRHLQDKLIVSNLFFFSQICARMFILATKCLNKGSSIYTSKRMVTEWERSLPFT